jgi:hypothetical protein
VRVVVVLSDGDGGVVTTIDQDAHYTYLFLVALWVDAIVYKCVHGYMCVNGDYIPDNVDYILVRGISSERSVKHNQLVAHINRV